MVNDTKDRSQAVLKEDGTLHNFLLRINGKSFHCYCGCNVFHKPDRTELSLYQCNACESQFDSERKDVK